MGPDTDTLKTVLADNRANISRYDVIPRKFNFVGFNNYVLVGIRRAGKSYLLYQRIRELLKEGLSSAHPGTFEGRPVLRRDNVREL